MCKASCHGDPKDPQRCAKHELDPLIAAGALRCGSLDAEAGSYGRWRHIECWRVPASVWLGLPNPDEGAEPAAFEEAILSMQSVTLCGFEELSQPLRAQFVQLYDLPLLERFADALALRFPDIRFPPLPPRGELDLNAVRQATYFFS